MEYIVLDIETTGFNYSKGEEITEIAGIRVVDGEVITSFSSLININGNINKRIENLTGINDKMLKNAPSFEIVYKKFIQALNIKKNDYIVIHNVSFDYNFINYWINKKKIEEKVLDDCKLICSLQLAKKVLPNESHKLENLKIKFGIKSKSHRALNDVLVTNRIYRELVKIKNTVSELKEK